MPAAKDVGEPGAGEPHARFDEAAGGIRRQWPQGPTVLAPPADPTATVETDTLEMDDTGKSALAPNPLLLFHGRGCRQRSAMISVDSSRRRPRAPVGAPLIGQLACGGLAPRPAAPRFAARGDAPAWPGSAPGRRGARHRAAPRRGDEQRSGAPRSPLGILSVPPVQWCEDLVLESPCEGPSWTPRVRRSAGSTRPR
jgi:hypothetical protein